MRLKRRDTLPFGCISSFFLFFSSVFVVHSCATDRPPRSSPLPPHKVRISRQLVDRVRLQQRLVESRARAHPSPPPFAVAADLCRPFSFPSPCPSALQMSAPAKEVHEDELVDYDEDAGAQTLEPEKKAAAKAKEVTR